MILLLGGTQETYSIAEALLAEGHHVIVSTATDTPLALPCHANLRHRSGRLDEKDLIGLLRDESVNILVDATHPYASVAHRTARRAAAGAGIRYIRWLRPCTDLTKYSEVLSASTHEEAARLACAIGETIFLTVGSRNLVPYVTEARRRGRRVIARVLPGAESLTACRRAGLLDLDVMPARGPFSVDENRAILRNFHVDVLVTKDSGIAGGVPAKLEAANLEHCQVVFVLRPREADLNPVRTLAQLLSAIRG